MKSGQRVFLFIKLSFAAVFPWWITATLWLITTEKQTWKVIYVVVSVFVPIRSYSKHKYCWRCRCGNNSFLLRLPRYVNVKVNHLNCNCKLYVFCSLRGISWPDSAFIFLRWFKLAHICIQVTTLHMWNRQGIYLQNFNRKSISRNTTHRQSLNLNVETANWLSYKNVQESR